MKKIKIIICLSLLFLLCGCSKGKIHEYDDFINYIDNMQLTLNDKSYSADLKNKYEVADDIQNVDGDGNKIRTITFKIKDSDLSFKVFSSLQCKSFIIDGSCAFGYYKYQLIDNYSYSVFTHYIYEYNNLINYNYDMCAGWNNLKELCYDHFLINSSDDLKYVINYLNDLLDYINKQDLRYITQNEKITILFAKTNEIGRRYSININFKIDNNRNYYFNFNDEYAPNDDELITYIENYMKANNIFL